ncbi:MAG: prepilin peptidase [Ardenticatenaceae bacterium]|nr:prepilin peptidase [Ardenticatenaceae bacterium]
MILLAFLIGLVTGWGLNWLSDLWVRQRQVTSYISPQLTRTLSPLLTALIFAYLWWGERPFTLLIFSFLWLITLIDLKYRLVPNTLTYPALVTVLAYHLWQQPLGLLPVLLGGGLAYAIFALTAWLRPGDLGGGDVKLAALFGFAFGFPHILWALLLGIGLGGGTAVFLLLRHHHRQQQIPYAPFLCLGAFIALLYNPWPF